MSPSSEYRDLVTMLAWFRQLSFRRVGPASTQQKTGGEGERLAAKFLREKCGMEVLAQNWRNPRDRRDELDLVCRDGGILVFVEVKTRDAGALVAGYYAIDKRKKKVLLRACRAYLRFLSRCDRPRTMRFDVVEVSMSPGGQPEVRHFENVPLFTKYE